MQGQGRRPRRPWYGGAARPDRGYENYDRRDNENSRQSPERPRIMPNEDLGERGACSETSYFTSKSYLRLRIE